MREPSEIVDTNFGRLSLVDESAYFAEVPWNRGIHIRLFVHVDGKDHQRCVENARKVFFEVQNNEMELLRQGIDFVEASEWESGFLNEEAEASIEIFSNGEGQLVYLLFMVGSLIVQFSREAAFMEASVMPG
ncbi:hypothetical protein [uncultured Desulfobulbus sp.]|uniref:hypothetical protein n=1 Tax=uncultured Desulfobulbus sp. TaxID=239745 RepID=UPI0029C710E2|nr:hypothetical protein [uncultured Desulfobulbus sp.]